MTRRRSVVLALAACLLVACHLGDAASASAQTGPPVVVEAPGGEVTITADLMEQAGPNVLIARGNVEMTRGTTRMLADRLEVNRDTGDTVGLGRVIFYDGNDRLNGERIDYNFKTGTGVVHNGQARTAPYYRIAGQVMERLDESHYLVRRGIFTTCEDDPPTWSFRFGTADADLEDIIYGTNASVWVKTLPVIPWFPILGAAVRKDRQTGFLFPTFGNSSRKGYFAEIPFFWAIDDSQDLTMELDLYSKHGVGLTGQYRYVLSRTAGGSINAFGIFETTVPDNQLNTPGATTPGSTTTEGTATRKPESRGWWGIQHNWLITPGLSFKTDINGVSDDLVLREYADNLYDRSRQSVQSNVFLTKTWTHANLVANMFWYQDLTTLRPVELNRFPDVRLTVPRQPLPGLGGVPGLSWLTYDVSAQYTKFVRDLGSDGSRLDLFPRLSLPLSVDGLFTITPFAAPRLTAFSKTRTGTQTLGDGTIIETTRDEPIVRRSIDLGADFEARASRLYDLRGFGGMDAILHSIEPRATYTWRDGADLDPSKLPQWANDNTPEASNVVFSLVNRLRARTVSTPGTEPFRWEPLRLTMSGGYDFKSVDRQVAPVRAELILDPGRYFYFRGDATYSIYKGEGVLAGNTDVVFNLPQFAASVGTRFTKASTNFIQGSTTWVQGNTTLLQGDTNFVQGVVRADINRYLSANISTAWDLRTDTFVENRVGLSVRFQCWALDFAYISRAKEQGLTGSDNEFRFGVYLLGVGGPFGAGQRFSGSGAAAVPGK